MLGVAADDDLDADGQETNAPSPELSNQKPVVVTPQRLQTQEGEQRKSDQDTAKNRVDSPATAGEIAYIGKKLKDKRMTIAQARQAAGLDQGDALDGLTKNDFNALKAALA
jgi:hypothetical protein